MTKINSKLLEDFMEENNLTKKQLADMCQISASKLERFMQSKNIRRALDTIYSISLVTKVRVDDLLYCSTQQKRDF